MKTFLFLFALLVGSTAFAQNNDQRYFELRIYYCNPGKLNTGDWKHFVCVRKGVDMLVYVNGVLAGQLPTPPAQPRNVTGSQPFKIGFQQGVSSFSNFYMGQIDDLLIYRKALTPAEITALYGL